jgi:MFS family permease
VVANASAETAARRSPPFSAALVAFAFFVVMSGTTLPTPLYPDYQQRYGFSVLIITVIFAVYALAVVGGLLLLGRLSDFVGRRRVLVPGLLLSAASAAFFLIAGGLGWILAGRVLSGVSAAIFTGTATAALVDLMPSSRRGTATVIAVAANLGGLGAGQLLSGVAGDHVSRPLQVPFAIDLGLCVLAFGALLLAHNPPPGRTGRWRPTRFNVPAAVRPVFVPAAVAGFCGFAVFGLYSAVVPVFIVHTLHIESATVTGAVVFVLMIAAAAGQIVTRRMRAGVALQLGCAMLIVGVALVAVSVIFDEFVPLLVATPVIGISQGLVIGAGLASINQLAPPDQRAEVASNYFVVLYIGLALPVMGVGLLALPWGSRNASLALAGAVIVTVGAVLFAFTRRPRDAGRVRWR